MVAHQVRVKVTGVRPDKNAGERELFTEETTSVLVIENGGVIRLSAAVTPGQLLFLVNEESKEELKREVVAQVKRKRTYRPTDCYVELEFAEPAPRFWGMEFSSATALLPKSAQEAEAAALVISAEATADEPGEPPSAPTVEEVQALRREVEELRKQMLMPTPAASEQAPALVPAWEATPAPVVGDVPSADSNSNSGSNEAPGVAFTAKSLPLDYDPAATQSTAAKQVPRPSRDFTMSLPKAKGSRRARGSFTPGFRAGALRLALLTTALVVTAAGAAWYKNWIPWKSAAQKPFASVPASAVKAKTSTLPGSQEAAKVRSESSNTKATSDAPVTSPSTPPRSEALPNTPAPVEADATESDARPAASSEPVAKPAARKTTPSTTLAAKRSTVRPAAEAAADPVAPSAAEGVIVPPKLIKSVRAVASVDAIRDFETGNVVIDAVVGATGEVESTNVLSGPPSLRDSAVETLKQYRYEPATQNGQPVPAHVTVTIHFRFER
jgi:TonB family protein